MKIIVYTCVTRGYDYISAPLLNNKDIEYICFHDGTIDPPMPWRGVLLNNEYKGAAANRHVKICFFEYEDLKSADILIYIDGSISVTGNLMDLITIVQYSEGHTFLFEHPSRTCVYAEARACAISKKERLRTLEKFVAKLRNDGMPENQGLFEGGIIFRKPSSVDCRHLMHEWWSEYKSSIKRDQLCLMYVCWKNGINIKSLGDPDHRRGRKYFSCRVGHNGDMVKRYLVWWIWRPIIKWLISIKIINL